MNSGIYCILNTKNGKRYLGQSTNIVKRRSSHFRSLCTGIHRNNHLQRSYCKYGKDSFCFSILEEVNEDLLDERERFWINFYKSNDGRYGYNLNDGGNLNKHHSVETKQKLSQAAKGRKLSDASRLKLSIASKGRFVSDETRDKLSKSLSGKKPSMESIRKMSESHLGKILSTETRCKMSVVKKGHVVLDETKVKISTASRNISDETRVKMSNAAKNMSIEHRNKLSLAQLGKHHSPESIAKMSVAHRNISEETRRKMSEAKKGKRPWNFGKSGSTKELAIGTKKAPGPLYGLGNDERAALALAITAAETSCSYELGLNVTKTTQSSPAIDAEETQSGEPLEAATES